MLNESKQAVLEAANLLIRAPDAQKLYDTMVSIVPVAKQHPIRLTGPAAALNALLELRLQAGDAYDRVMSLIESKRREVGYEPLQRPADDRFNKTEYMRSFMDQKRERERRAAKIENMIRPASEALRGRARLDFMQRQSASWKRDRDALLEHHRVLGGGTISRENLHQLLDQFWNRVDAELDELEELAMQEIRNPTRRKLVGVDLSGLHAALADQPYR